MSPRGRVGMYGFWQWRDYLIDRGLPILIVGSLLGYLTVAPMMPALSRNLASMSPRVIAKYGGVDAATAYVMKDFNGMVLRNFLGALVFVGALLAMNGIVANDRKLGYYRFLFSKPVAPWRYYGQAFVVHWVGYVAAMALLGLLYGVLVWPVLSVPLLIAVALMFLTYGGITFALSAAARWDWLSLVSVTVAANYFWERYKESDSMIAKLLYVLPPLHRTSDVYSAVAKGEPLPWHLLEWFAGYGIACFLLGLLVLRFRRLAIV
ncbi:MAG: hypothetical protein ABI625_07710 [bacterium]